MAVIACLYYPFSDCMDSQLENKSCRMTQIGPNVSKAEVSSELLKTWYRRLKMKVTKCQKIQEIIMHLLYMNNFGLLIDWKAAN